ncbi:biotin transporter BioY [Candidatus Poribacteria bacterium]|nr:MAG: biotin transporter BioY [Candidatus Poribacteria bacterium]
MRGRERSLTVLELIWSLDLPWRKAVAVLSFAVLTALCAKARIPLPFTPVPITFQTFAVLLSGLALGPYLGLASTALYLAMGLSGLPIFSMGGGLSYLLGPTGGYLVGFLLASHVVGRLAWRGWDRSYLRCLAAMGIGELLIYLPGLLWLSRFVPKGSLLAAGLIPFIPGDLIKIGLIALCMPTVWRLTGKSGEVDRG